MIRGLQPQIKLYLFEHLNLIYNISFYPPNKVILAINYTFVKQIAISQSILAAIKVFTYMAK